MDEPIVEEELALIERTCEALAKIPAPKSASQAPIVRELERLRSLGYVQ